MHFGEPKQVYRAVELMRNWVGPEVQTRTARQWWQIGGPPSTHVDKHVTKGHWWRDRRTNQTDGGPTKTRPRAGWPISQTKISKREMGLLRRLQRTRAEYEQVGPKWVLNWQKCSVFVKQNPHS